jgi:hypothetical protein
MAQPPDEAASENSSENSGNDIPPADAADDPAAAPANDRDASELWERLIYLPYKHLKRVFGSRDASVLIPYVEYLTLRAQSGAVAPKPDQPPVSALITESHYAGRVEKSAVRIDAEFLIQVIDKPWAEVPLSFGAAAVGKMTSDSGKVLLRGTGDGTYSLLLPSKGAHRVQLQLVAPIRTTPEGHRFEFSCPQVAITTLDLAIPEEDQVVELEPRLLLLPQQSAENETRIKASLGSTGRIAAKWHLRAGLQPELELLASVTNRLHVRVEEGLVHSIAQLEYEVLRGSLQQLHVAVPLGHRILDVSAPQARVRSWQAEADENRQLVTVELLGSVGGNITVEVHTEVPITAALFEVAGVDDEGRVHGIHSVGTVRERGDLVVTHSAAIALSVEQQQGLLRVDAGDVAKQLRQPNSLYYRFFSPRMSLLLQARSVEPRVTVHQDARFVFDHDELRLRSVFGYEVERAGVFELRIEIPQGLNVESASVPGMKEYRVDVQTGVLSITLDQKQLGTFQVQVAARRELDRGQNQETAPLPLPTPLGVVRETGRIWVYAHSGIELITAADEVVGAYPEVARRAERLANVRLAAAWVYSRRPVEIPVRTVRKPTRLSAKVGTSIDVAEELIEIRVKLEYLVEHAGIDTFRFALPAQGAENVEISARGEASAPGIKQKTSDEDAAEGWVVWTVVMQQEVLGPQHFEITYDLKPAERLDAEPTEAEADATSGETEGAPTRSATTLKLLRVLGLDAEEGEEQAIVLARVIGEAAVSKDRALSVAAKSTGDDVEMIDIRELKILPHEGALAYRYHRQPAELALSWEKREIHEVVETVVSRGLVEIALGRDNQATYRCRYRMTSSERQRLPIGLPLAAEPLGVFIDNTAVSLEKEEGAQTEGLLQPYVVNVARSKRSDEPFLLTLQFVWRVNPAPFETKSGVIELPIPQVGAGKSGVAVQQLRSAVWLPEEFALFDSTRSLVSETRARLTGLLFGRLKGRMQTSEWDEWIGGETVGGFDFPKEGHAYLYSSLGVAETLELTWWEMPFYTLVLSVTIVAIAWLLRNTSWENKLGFLLFAGFFVAVYALSDAERAYHGLMASRYGLITLLGYWLIHALFRPRPLLPEVPPVPSRRSVLLGAGGHAVVVPPPGVFERMTSQARKVK